MKPSATLPLLVEIGCEEIPARFLAEAQTGLGEGLAAALREARLLPVGTTAVETHSTPRRLVARVPGVLKRQRDQVQEIMGPPVKVAFDGLGKPTRAAESFAEKNGAQVADLERLTTPKGEYLALKKTLEGADAAALLPELLKKVVEGIRFPKSMYWVAKAGPRFVRPVRWLLALLGEGKVARTVEFEFAGVRAGNTTFGHRVAGRKPIRVASFQDYVTKLHRKHVEIDPRRRRFMASEACKVLVEDNLVRIEDKYLEDWVVNSTEWPSAILGSFDARFLNLPREILITVMRDHQKYFAVEDKSGNLKPHFIAILNVESDAAGLIRPGHERVLAARFADAEFFWHADQKVSLRERQAQLAAVTYQAELGRLHAYDYKVARMYANAEKLCDSLGKQGRLSEEETVHALRAVRFCKCDLTTQMVQEFPELQGIVGGLYARAQREPAGVADAIYDHYRPQGMEDTCPRTVAGAVVALSDKIDAVVTGFSVGYEPTGSSDPFGIRRDGNGIIKVLVELLLPIDLKEIANWALTNLSLERDVVSEWGRRFSLPEKTEMVLGFLEERLRFYLETVLQLRYDTVRAVLAAGWNVPVEAVKRAQALEAMRGSDDLAAISAAAKRIKNILKKSATAEDWGPGEIDGTLLQEEEERVLHARYASVAAASARLAAASEYGCALDVIAGLRPVVDRFFDKVLVMVPDAEVRRNRLRLLGKLDELFSGIAQFAEIVPVNVGASTSESSGGK